MTKEKTVESLISGFTSSILRAHFGKGPESVHVTVHPPFVCIQIKEFLAPIEKTLLSQKEKNRVLETRDLLMLEVRDEFKRNFCRELDLDVLELYADWNLDKRSGIILGVLDNSNFKETDKPENIDESTLIEEIIKVSILGQKEPGATKIYWLSDRTLLIERTSIFILLEKELIKNGFIEELKLAKRPLEYKLFMHSKMEEIMGRPITDVFVDWHFEKDKGYAILNFQK